MARDQVVRPIGTHPLWQADKRNLEKKANPWGGGTEAVVRGGGIRRKKREVEVARRVKNAF